MGVQDGEHFQEIELVEPGVSGERIVTVKCHPIHDHDDANENADLDLDKYMAGANSGLYVRQIWGWTWCYCSSLVDAAWGLGPMKK